jgi:two-component system response regulator DevR
MTPPSTIRLYIVDDHPIVRTGLYSIESFAPHIQIVGEADSVEAAWSGIRQLQPDVVLLDIRLRDGNGIDLCRQIKAARPGTRVLLLSSFVDDQLILTALDAGADGYMLKEDDAQRLVGAIETVSSGDAVLNESVRQRLVAGKEYRREIGGPSLECLTAQERRLLAEVAKGKTDKEVGAELGLSPKTARNYLDRIFTKLGVHTRTEAASAFILSGRRRWDDA